MIIREPLSRKEDSRSERRDVLGKDEKKGKREEGKGKERARQAGLWPGAERRACSRSSRFVDLEWNARHNLP